MHGTIKDTRSGSLPSEVKLAAREVRAVRLEVKTGHQSNATEDDQQDLQVEIHLQETVPESSFDLQLDRRNQGLSSDPMPRIPILLQHPRPRLSHDWGWGRLPRMEFALMGFVPLTTTLRYHPNSDSSVRLHSLTEVSLATHLNRRRGFL